MGHQSGLAVTIGDLKTLMKAFGEQPHRYLDVAVQSAGFIDDDFLNKPNLIDLMRELQDRLGPECFEG